MNERSRIGQPTKQLLSGKEADNNKNKRDDCWNAKERRTNDQRKSMKQNKCKNKKEQHCIPEPGFIFSFFVLPTKMAQVYLWQDKADEERPACTACTNIVKNEAKEETRYGGRRETT